MSGHSKWSKIKRKKGANDQKRGKMVSRIVKEITVAVKEGGSADADFNPRLRTAINNAKGVNMPKENIERAIKKAAEEGGDNYSELTYEGYAPGGVAVFVECLTDNTNRTVANIRALFNKNGGNLATTGSVGFLFDRKSIFEFPLAEWDEDELTLELIDHGAEDIEVDGGEVTVTGDYADFGNLNKKLEDLGITPTSARLDRIPQQPSDIDLPTAKSALKLIDKFEDDDDVQNVFHNMGITDEIMAALESEE